MPLDQQDIISRFHQAIATFSASQPRPQGTDMERQYRAVRAYTMKIGFQPEDDLLPPVQLEKVLAPALPPEHRLSVMAYLGDDGDMGSWVVVDHKTCRDSPIHLLISRWGDIFVPGRPPVEAEPPTTLVLYNMLMRLMEYHQNQEELNLLYLRIREAKPLVRNMLLKRCFDRIAESTNTPEDA